MSDWRRTTLGEVLNFQRGFDITRATQREGTIPVVSSGGISSYHDASSAKGPGVVIGRKGTLGKTFYLPGDYWPHDTTLWVQDFKGSHPRFVYYFMSQLDVSWLDAGSANPTLNRNHLHPLSVAWPPVAEQRAIAEVLGALDDKIAANTQLVITSEELAISLLFPLVPSIPLYKVVTHRKTTISPEGLPSSLVAHYSLPAFDVGVTPELVHPAEIKSNKFSINQPSLLVSKLNPRFPRIWDVVDVPDVPAVASTEFLVLEPIHSSTSVLWAILRQPGFGMALEAKVAGTSGSHQRVKPADLLATSVVDPRLLSDGCHESLKSLGAVRSNARKEIIELGALRDALLPRLMAGTLAVKDVEKLVEAAL